MWAVAAGYHRYFSYRSRKTGRIFQFALAFLAQCSAPPSGGQFIIRNRTNLEMRTHPLLMGSGILILVGLFRKTAKPSGVRLKTLPSTLSAFGSIIIFPSHPF
jgi:hypothetical protein